MNSQVHRALFRKEGEGKERDMYMYMCKIHYGTYSRGHRKVPVPLPFRFRATIFTVPVPLPYRFRFALRPFLGTVER